MATAFIADSQLKLVFNTGVDGEGNPIFKSKSLRNVKVTASTDGLYAVAQSLIGLQQYPVTSIERNDNSLLGA